MEVVLFPQLILRTWLATKTLLRENVLCKIMGAAAKRNCIKRNRKKQQLYSSLLKQMLRSLQAKHTELRKKWRLILAADGYIGKRDSIFLYVYHN